jgi:serine/threonine protein kinase
VGACLAQLCIATGRCRATLRGAVASQPESNPPETTDPSVDPTPLCDGRFVPFRRLGSGSQAETLEAVDRAHGCAVAIKRFNVHGASNWKDVELAEREARVLSKLSHPALPAYVHHFEQDGALYLVMEKVEGEDLAKRLESGKRFSFEELSQLLEVLADVFAYLHQLSPPVLHRDVKPSNIVQRPDGGFALIDFGSVRDGLRPAGGSTVVGTFGFMAPEQFQGRAVPATDLYGTGATILTLLTGLTPDRLPHRGLQVDVRAALPASTPEPWIALLDRLLVLDPDQRSVSLRSLLPALAPSRPPDANHSPASPRPHPGLGDSDANAPILDGLYRQDSDWIIGGGTMLPFFLVVVLSLLRLALFLVLQVAVPTLLTLLSIFFGRSLKNAAADVSRAGQTTHQQLSRAIAGISRANPVVGRRRHRHMYPPGPFRHRRAVFDDEPPPAPRDARNRRRMRIGDFDVELPPDAAETREPEPPRRRQR